MLSPMFLKISYYYPNFVRHRIVFQKNDEIEMSKLERALGSLQSDTL